MGWKTSMVIVNSNKEFNRDELFESMGYFNLKKTEDQYFESIIHPDDDRIYIGKFSGNTIFCLQDLPLESMDETPSNEELVLSEKFPDTEIISFVLHSVVNFWGYSITKNNKKIRVRAGSSEGGTMVEFGEILEEEKKLYSQSSINEEGLRVFKFNNLPGEYFLDEQVGENFIFEISRRYLGKNLDCCDELFATKFEGFSFSRTKPKNGKINSQKNKTNPWWKFW